MVEIAARTPDTATTWVEPFVGGAWMLDAAHASGRFSRLLAGDALEDVILCYRAVADGWDPPRIVTREDHARLRHAPPSALRALVGFGSCYGGTFFSGFCGDALNGKRTNSEIAADHLIRRRPLFAAADLRHQSYEAWEPDIGPGVVVYCDPPYDGTYLYRGTDPFDSQAFWDWCHRMAARGAEVFVSEYSAPLEVMPRQVWARTAKQTAARHANAEVTERLFHIPAVSP